MTAIALDQPYYERVDPREGRVDEMLIRGQGWLSRRMAPIRRRRLIGFAIQAEQLSFTKRRMAELTAHHTGQELSKIQADSERDRWFTAEEAVTYGLVDKVILKRGEIR